MKTTKYLGEHLKNKTQCSSHPLPVITSKGKVFEKLLKFQTKHPQNAAEQKFLFKSRAVQCHGCQSFHSFQKQKYGSASIAKLYIGAMTKKLCLISL